MKRRFPTAEEFTLSLLANPKPTCAGWIARCPAHDDNRASLSVAEGEKGQVLLFCHAGCTVEEILNRLDLTFVDLYCGGAR